MIFSNTFRSYEISILNADLDLGISNHHGTDLIESTAVRHCFIAYVLLRLSFVSLYHIETGFHLNFMYYINQRIEHTQGTCNC